MTAEEMYEYYKKATRSDVMNADIPSTLYLEDVRMIPDGIIEEDGLTSKTSPNLIPERLSSSPASKSEEN